MTNPYYALIPISRELHRHSYDDCEDFVRHAIKAAAAANIQLRYIVCQVEPEARSPTNRGYHAIAVEAGDTWALDLRYPAGPISLSQLRRGGYKIPRLPGEPKG